MFIETITGISKVFDKKDKNLIPACSTLFSHLWNFRELPRVCVRKTIDFYRILSDFRNFSKLIPKCKPLTDTAGAVNLLLLWNWQHNYKRAFDILQKNSKG